MSKSVTFSLGGHFERCRALALAVAIVGHNPEAIFGVWHEVLDGDLHLPWTTGIHDSLPDRGGVGRTQTGNRTVNHSDLTLPRRFCLMLVCKKQSEVAFRAPNILVPNTCA